MKREFYEVVAKKGYDYEEYVYALDGSSRSKNPQSIEDWYKQNVVEFKVMADCHEQHIWNKTELVGVSKAGLKKFNALKDAGYKFSVTVGGSSIALIGWR